MTISLRASGSIYLQGKEGQGLLFDPTSQDLADEASVLVFTKPAEGNFSKRHNQKIIQGPGEYEINKISIQGVGVGPRAAYLVEMEGINIVNLGFLKEINLAQEVVALLSSSDILFVPAGGGDAGSASSGAKLVSMLDPKIVVPINIKSKNHPDLEGPEVFLKELGKEALPAKDKLSIKAKDIPQEGPQIVLLKSQ